MYVVTLNQSITANRRTVTASLDRETDKAVLVRITETRTSGRLAGEESSEDIWLPKSQLLAWGFHAVVTDKNWLAEDKLRSAAAVTRRFGLEGQFSTVEDLDAAQAKKAQAFADGSAELAITEHDSFGDIFPWAKEA